MPVVATWNVNGIRARLDKLLEWLDARSPDIVMLQEIKTDDEGYPEYEIERAGYVSVTHCQKAWNGVAVLAHNKANLIERGLPGSEEAGSRLVTADVEGLVAASIYVPNGKSTDHPDFPAKIKWLETLVDYISASFPPDQPVVIGGDFNIVPDDISSYDPAGLAGTIFHTEEERALYRRLIDLGFVDLYREINPDEPGYTWWDYRAGNFHKNLGLRIDLLLGTPPIASNVKEVWIDREFRKGKKPSDHAPLIAEIASTA